MIDLGSKLLIFIKDFTGRGADRFYWLVNDRLEETSAADVVAFPGAIVCHDFWMIRDVLYDKVGDLPATVIDVDELRISISGNPDDRITLMPLPPKCPELNPVENVWQFMRDNPADPLVCAQIRRRHEGSREFGHW